MVKTKKETHGYCDNKKCKKKLLVPSWKLCEDCDFKQFSKAYFNKRIKQIRIQLNEEKKKQKKYKNVEYFIVDEFNKIIGYKLLK